MKCMYCQGKMERGVAPFHVDRKGYHLVLDKVPAYVCRQCGEVYFAETEVDDLYGNKIENPLRLVNKKPITATAAELKQNPRSRSAKLRVAEKKD